MFEDVANEDPVDAMTLNVPLVLPSTVPLIRPVVSMLKEVGRFVLEYHTTGFPLLVVAVTYTGVIATF